MTCQAQALGLEPRNLKPTLDKVAEEGGLEPRNLKPAPDRVAEEEKEADEVHYIAVRQRRKGARRVLLLEKLLAEFVGSFFLVMTVGVSVVGGSATAPVAIGLVLAAQTCTLGAISGGFFNPAVTLAVLLSGRKKISARNAVFYAAVQFLGAIVGGFVAFVATDSSFCFDYALVKGWRTSLVLEACFTMALCSTVLSTLTSHDAPNQYFGFAIGMTFTAGALASRGHDQGSFNPAVTLGINLANYANGDVVVRHPSASAWALFLLAPCLGSLLAAAFFRAMRGGEYRPAEKALVSFYELDDDIRSI